MEKTPKMNNSNNANNLYGAITQPYIARVPKTNIITSCQVAITLYSLHRFIEDQSQWNVSPISSLTSCKNLVGSSSIPGLLSVFRIFSCSTTFSLVNLLALILFHHCLKMLGWIRAVA